jgi:hypothetical protein
MKQLWTCACVVVGVCSGGFNETYRSSDLDRSAGYYAGHFRYSAGFRILPDGHLSEHAGYPALANTRYRRVYLGEAGACYGTLLYPVRVGSTLKPTVGVGAGVGGILGDWARRLESHAQRGRRSLVAALAHRPGGSGLVSALPCGASGVQTLVMY